MQKQFKEIKDNVQSAFRIYFVTIWFLTNKEFRYLRIWFDSNNLWHSALLTKRIEPISKMKRKSYILLRIMKIDSIFRDISYAIFKWINCTNERITYLKVKFYCFIHIRVVLLNQLLDIKLVENDILPLKESFFTPNIHNIILNTI